MVVKAFQNLLAYLGSWRLGILKIPFDVIGNEEFVRVTSLRKKILLPFLAFMVKKFRARMAFQLPSSLLIEIM